MGYQAAGKSTFFFLTLRALMQLVTTFVARSNCSAQACQQGKAHRSEPSCQILFSPTPPHVKSLG